VLNFAGDLTGPEVCTAVLEDGVRTGASSTAWLERSDSP
jgi:hypothetical protein